MVASQAVLDESPISIALHIAEQMQTLAVAGEWQRIEEITPQLQRAILNVPESERRPVLLEVQRSLLHVADAATHARQVVTEKISDLRRGQVAKKAYELR